jgi:hypothetical protein
MRVYRIYKDLELNLLIKPLKRLVRDKPEALTVPEGINQVWSMDFMHDQLEDCRTFRLFNVIDDFNHEASGGKAGRGSENKVVFVAAVSLTEDDRSLWVRLTPVSGFTLKAISAWAGEHLAPGSKVLSDGLACFGAITKADCSHHATVMAGRKPKEVLEFRWINTVLGNLKTSLSGCLHSFDYRKYADRYHAAFCYRFNRRFNLRTLHQRLLIAAATTGPKPRHRIRHTDVHC